MKRGFIVSPPGPVSYAYGLSLQEDVRSEISSGRWDGGLVLLEHTPVITIGRSGGTDALLVDAAGLRRRGVEVYYCERGGKATCHNPGQLVGYPVLDLRSWRLDAHWYVDCLEEVIIRTLREFGLVCGRKARYTGVWHGDSKIAAIGIALKQWITGHGFALNVNNDMNLFKTIIPCGITDFGVTSLRQAGVEASVSEAAAVFIKHFTVLFDCEMDCCAPGDPAQLKKLAGERG